MAAHRRPRPGCAAPGPHAGSLPARPPLRPPLGPGLLLGRRGADGETPWVRGPSAGRRAPAAVANKTSWARGGSTRSCHQGTGLEDGPAVGRESGGEWGESRGEERGRAEEGDRFFSALPARSICPHAGRQPLHPRMLPSPGLLRLCPWLSAVLIAAGSSLEANQVAPKVTKGRNSAVGRERRPCWPLAAWKSPAAVCLGLLHF